MRKVLACGFILSWHILLAPLSELPAQAQSWSAWKQLAQEQTSKGQLAQAADSWRAGYRLAREHGSKDARLYISALELAKVQVSQKKNTDACHLLNEVCTNELGALDLICPEEISCLQTYLDLLKQSQDKVETERVEKLFAQIQHKRSSASSASSLEKPAVSIVFGDAAKEELKNKITQGQQLIEKKEYAAAQSCLNEALASASSRQVPGMLYLVLEEQTKLFSLMKDYKKAEAAAERLLEVAKQESGAESRSYLDALGEHAKLLNILGQRDRAAIEDTSFAILAAKLNPAAVNQAGKNAGNGSSATIPAKKLAASALGGNFKDDGVSIADLIARVDKGSKDLNLLKFVAGVLYENGDYQRCLPYVEKLTLLEPSSAKDQLFLCNVYLQLHRPNDAVEPANRAIFLSPDAESYGNLIDVYTGCSDMTNQLNALKEFISRFPSNPKTPGCQTEMEQLEKAMKESASSEYSLPTEIELARCWKKRVPMPIKVCLKDNTTAEQVLCRPEGKDARHPRELCQDALDSWASASGGRISFTLWDDPNTAQITIHYLRQGDAILAENCAAGVTEWGPGCVNALIFLGLLGKDGHAIDRDRFFATTLHEIGHALGLEHSSRSDDVMYWQEHNIQPKAPSTNDQRRITTLYGN